MAEARCDLPGKYRQSDIHHWADWVELCCVESLDGYVTRKEMEIKLQRRKTLQTKKVQESEEDGTELSLPLEEDRKIVENDREFEVIGIWFTHLKRRAFFLGDAYPFSVGEEDGGRLVLKEQLSESHLLYLSLLMMANLYCFGDLEAILTSDFERICQVALKSFFPAVAEVHVFGKGKSGASRYQGNVFERITRLAGDLNGTMLAKQEHFPPQSTGDAGLDLVAWLPFDDPAPGRFAIFGQCACTPEWTSKQNSSAPNIWCSGKMILQCEPVNAVFTPFYLRELDGTWHRPATDYGPYLHIDRLRLMKILSATANQFSDLDTFQEAKEFADEKVGPY